MTVVVNGDDQVLDQIYKQLNKLVDVVDIKELKDDHSVCRELVLVKIRCSAQERQAVNSIVDIFRAKIVDVGKESMIIEMTGARVRLTPFIQLLDGHEILELARTGISGLSRGCDDVRIL